MRLLQSTPTTTSPRSLPLSRFPKARIIFPLKESLPSSLPTGLRIA